jgi:hypothetical protein
VLVDAGVIAQPRALLTGGRGAPLEHIHAHLQYVLERDPIASAARNEELGFLANTMAAASTVLSRSLTVQEASDAALAVCNLGLENRAAPEGDLPGRQDLVGVFQTGWRILYEDVSMYSAEHLILALSDRHPADPEIRRGLRSLRIELTRHWRAGTPWLARDAMEIITMLDMPAWAALVALIDEFPVMHAGIAASRDRRVRAVGAADFEFISANSQIQAIRDFITSLPGLLNQGCQPLTS